MTYLKKSKPIDLIYVEGPGNIVESLKRWHIKEDFSVHTSINFSGQLFDFCKNNNLKTLAVSSGTKAKERVEFENFSAFGKPKIMINGSLGYHLSQTLYGLYIIGLCLRYRPKYLHITSGVTHWFVLAPIKLIGVKIFPQFHNTFWAKGFPPSGKIKLLLLKLDAWFLKYIAAGAACCSLEIKRQIEEITQNKNCPIFVFKPQFYRKTFENYLPPLITNKPFSIVFAGRIESDKGIFDILMMAEKLKDENVIFHICGDGSERILLRDKCKNLGLENQVVVYGGLERSELLTVYQKGHAIIVPTRSEFPEGFAMTAVESILIDRPVITSEIVPALELLRSACVEAQPNDVESYVGVIKNLMSDYAYYKEKQNACLLLKEQFLDGKEGLTKILENTLIAN